MNLRKRYPAYRIGILDLGLISTISHMFMSTVTRLGLPLHTMACAMPFLASVVIAC